jgi:hypothetical protein
VRVANKPQMFVNLVSVAIGFSGLVKAFGWPNIPNLL